MNCQKGLVSIVIPVCNAERHLRRCFDSVLEQTYSQIEIIVVNDGSSDSSLEICNEYAGNDDRIHVINKANTGVSDTRNQGLLNANGEFVAFIDSDDYVGKDYISHLVSLMNDDVDLGISGWIKESEDGLAESKAPSVNEFCDQDQCLAKLVSLNCVQGYPFSKIFRNKILRENNICFDKDIIIFEDLLFCCEYVNYCNKTNIDTDLADYYYVIHKNGSRYLSVHSPVFDPKWITEVYSLEEILSLTGKSKKAQKTVRARIALSSSFYINRMFECKYEDSVIKKELQGKVRKNLGAVLTASEGDIKWKMQAFLCAVSPEFEFWIKSHF